MYLHMLMCRYTYIYIYIHKYIRYIYIIWASLVAQLVKNPPPMWETWV